MDTNTLIKTESCPNDNYEPPGVIPYGDSFIAPYSPTPSEYQPSPSPEKPSRLESLPKAPNQINPMAQAIDLSITSKSCRPSTFQGDWLTVSKILRLQRRTSHTHPRDILTEPDGNPPTKPILMSWASSLRVNVQQRCDPILSAI
jgi:hypothetical protein